MSTLVSSSRLHQTPLPLCSLWRVLLQQYNFYSYPSPLSPSLTTTTTVVGVQQSVEGFAQQLQIARHAILKMEQYSVNSDKELSSSSLSDYCFATAIAFSILQPVPNPSSDMNVDLALSSKRNIKKTKKVPLSTVIQLALGAQPSCQGGPLLSPSLVIHHNALIGWAAGATLALPLHSSTIGAPCYVQLMDDVIAGAEDLPSAAIIDSFVQNLALVRVAKKRRGSQPTPPIVVHGCHFCF